MITSCLVFFYVDTYSSIMKPCTLQLIKLAIFIVVIIFMIVIIMSRHKEDFTCNPPSTFAPVADTTTTATVAPTTTQGVITPVADTTVAPATTQGVITPVVAPTTTTTQPVVLAYPKFIYDVRQGQDSNGNDIKKVEGSLEDIRKACDEAPDCKGFNTGGYIKHTMASSWTNTPGLDFYKKLNAVNYRRMVGKDSNGNDIKRVEGSLEDIRKACDAIPECKGFNTGGYIKHTMAPSWSNTPGLDFYEKQNTQGVSPQTIGILYPKFTYAIHKGQDSNGNDIKKVDGSLADIRDACDSAPDCKGFNTGGYIKHTMASSWTTNPKLDFYEKQNAVEYRRMTGKDSNGNDLRQVQGSLEDIRKACDEAPDCKGFNTGGYIKHTMAPSWTTTPGLDFYEKQNAVKYRPRIIGKDSNLNDIKRVDGSLTDIRKACDADAACKGFNSAGWLKNKITDTLRDSKDNILFIRQ